VNASVRAKEGPPAFLDGIDAASRRAASRVSEESFDMRASRKYAIRLCAVLTFVVPATHPAAQIATPADLQDLAAADAAVDAATASRFQQALLRHRPVYRFDSDEDFFPLGVAAITNNTGNRLLRVNNALIARRNADGSGLNLSYLRFPVYPNGDAVLHDDKLVERHGSSNPDAD